MKYEKHVKIINSRVTEATVRLAFGRASKAEISFSQQRLDQEYGTEEINLQQECLQKQSRELTNGNKNSM